ncbi:MAG: ABC transporter ATP-binding protein, partial [Chlorobi bacterium]|nr:ABC transporter ATP-binding protein [Chlorobiota bacterium]
SLLEVGTGFHPELTGRENIFLNGAILGMTKREIRSKLDEIIAFSGVERYIDTPVKRYSSGMMVRLGFAVAAHLEPEILVVDEVLAVGDAEFQKKAIGKMQDVSKQDGRTVLFVSHNMGAVKNLCNSGVILENGMVKYMSDNIQDVISKYIIDGGGDFVKTKRWNLTEARGNDKVKLTKVGWDSDRNGVIDTITDFYLDFEFHTFLDFEKFNLSVTLKTLDDVTVSALVSDYVKIRRGVHSARLFIPGKFLNNLAYKLDIYFVEKEQIVCFLDNIFNFEVVDNREGMEWYGHWIGCVRPDFKFVIQN